jgi:hypothetical protein
MVRKRVHAITAVFCGMIADEHDRNRMAPLPSKSCGVL